MSNDRKCVDAFEIIFWGYLWRLTSEFGSSHDILWLGFAFWIVWRGYLWWGFLLVAKLFPCIPHAVEQIQRHSFFCRTHSTCYPISTRKVIESSLDFAALRILGKGYCLRISKTYRWMLDGRDSRTYIKSDLKGWRHRSICFFGAFDRLFDVSATHYDVFFPRTNAMEIWSHPHTPFLYGVPGNVEERSNITEPRCFQPGFPDVMVFAGPESNQIYKSVCHLYDLLGGGFIF